MLIKPRTIPVKILVLSALLERLSANHPGRPLYEEELGKRIWGHRGEQSVDYYLDFLKTESCFILHGLKLSNNGHNFLIDTLVIFPEFTLIVEVKHWSGVLEVQERGDLVKWDGSVKRVYENPVQQAKHQQWQLESWLESRHLTLPPIEHLAVFTNSRLVLENTQYLSPKMIRSNCLLDYIYSLKRHYAASPPPLSNSDLKKVISRIKRNHIKDDFINSPLSQLGLSEDDLKLGVSCPVCQKFSMSRVKRTWYCASCGMSFQNAHIKALTDYVLLFGRYAQNKDLQKFLHIEDPRTVRRLLLTLKVSRKGITTNSQFDLLSSEVIKNEIDSLREDRKL